MTVFDATRICFRKYFVFSGRAVRSEYWWFVLFVLVISTVLAGLDAALFGVDPETKEGRRVMAPVFQLGVAFPMLAAGWRRLQDTGRPGWYLLLPTGLGIMMVILLFSGLVVLSGFGPYADTPDALTGPAGMLVVIGVGLVFALQLGLSILMIWWLTRPSQEGANDYGPAVV
ncbi:DUF805 domain-containing protein [Aliisedimentitalea scapharcae]|uniref:DUF805 domain-containing protein n=1 Tax=Aliisedimentitalea scapharcae TaxID=1524259 RepID=A0ABZ2XQ97_9RHOB